MKILPAFIGLALVACGTDPSPTPSVACPTGPPTSVSAQASLEGAGLATVTVSGAVSGEFVFELYGDEAPLATANFADLARCGFYDDIKFHRVLSGFVIQAGDPETANHDVDFEEMGRGGPGYQLEIEPVAEGLTYDPYSVSMANNQRFAGSQFFVALDDLDDALRQSGVYTIFGQVTSGTDTVDAIAAVPVNDPRIGVPVDAVTIDSIVISASAPEE